MRRSRLPTPAPTAGGVLIKAKKLRFWSISLQHSSATPQNFIEWKVHCSVTLHLRLRISSTDWNGPKKVELPCTEQ